MRSSGRDRRPLRGARVTADRVFDLAPHLTERDREIVLCVYDYQLLTTDQLELLFFTSKRRAQDRLLFLYRHRLLDRFCPPLPFGAGKPQAHWLLDEAGAILVAAILGVDRKQLGWQRRDDWSSHPQLRHRLELNRFVTDLIAATVPDPSIGVRAWYSSRASPRLTLRPDLARPIHGRQPGAYDGHARTFILGRVHRACSLKCLLLTQELPSSR